MHIKRFFFFTLCFLSFSLIFSAGNQTKTGDSLSKITFSEKIFPGDPFIVNFSFLAKPKDFIYAKAQFFDEKSEKKITQALFYSVSDKKNNYVAILPISTMIKPGKYLLNIDFFLNEKSTSEAFSVEVVEKKFVSETIHLNQSNTAKKTNTGIERMRQIEKLYTLLATIDYNSAAQIPSFSLPVTSTRRTSFFGDRRMFVYNTGGSSTELHYGIDFGVPTGTPIVSCADGKVVLAEERVTTGFSVVIEHLPGLYSLYYHLEKFTVSEEQKVAKGEQIGFSGATGLATGPHLHWEVRLLGQAINPDFFVRGN